MNYSADH